MNQWTKFFTFEGFQNMFKEFSNSFFDNETLMQNQKKNAESLTNLAHHAMENLKEIGEMQQQYMQQYMENLREAGQQMVKPGQWEEKVAYGSEFINHNVSEALNHSQKTIDFIQRFNQRMSENMNNQFSETMEENIKTMKKANNKKR